MQKHHSTVIFAGAISSVVQYLAPLWYTKGTDNTVHRLLYLQVQSKPAIERRLSKKVCMLVGTQKALSSAMPLH
jgi:hypothetical protein